MEYNTLLIFMTIIFSIIILFTSIEFFKKNQYSFLIEGLVIYIFYLIFLVTQYKFKFHVSIFIILLVLITIIGNNLVGNYLNVYNTSKHYDRFLHAFGSFSFSLFNYSILIQTTMLTINPKFYVSIFVASMGISLGCIYEIYEFISDSAVKSNNQHGLKDTNFDLISDVIGSIIAGIASMLIFF